MVIYRIYKIYMYIIIMEPSDNNHINIIPEMKQKVTVKASEIIQNLKASKIENHFVKKIVSFFLLMFRPLFPKRIRFR